MEPHTKTILAKIHHIDKLDNIYEIENIVSRLSKTADVLNSENKSLTQVIHKPYIDKSQSISITLCNGKRLLNIKTNIDKLDHLVDKQERSDTDITIIADGIKSEFNIPIPESVII